MSRLAIQILFVVLGALWFAYSAMTFLGATMGDCFDVQLCGEIKRVAVGVVLWRWFAGCLVLFGAYRFFRKDPDV